MANSEGARGSAGLVSFVRTRGGVSGLVEERESSHATVQDVLGEVSRMRGEDGAACGPSFKFRISLFLFQVVD